MHFASRKWAPYIYIYSFACAVTNNVSSSIFFSVGHHRGALPRAPGRWDTQFKSEGERGQDKILRRRLVKYSANTG